MSNSCDPWTVASRLLSPWDFPGKNTGVGCHFLFRGSSQPRDQTWVSCIAGRFLSDCATREASFTYVCIHTHTHRYIYASYQIIFLYRLLQNVEYTFLCCKVGSCWLSIWYIVAFMHWRRKWQPAPVFLPGESQGRWSLMGCCLWGHTESGTTEAT